VSDAPFLYGSLTRISDLPDGAFEVVPRDRAEWELGDYVVVEVTELGAQRNLEHPSGRLAHLARGDVLVGALGIRHATLEATGDWRAVGEDLEMHLLTAAGLFGRLTSLSPMLGSLSVLGYRGHVARGGATLRMADFVPSGDSGPYATPTILIIGTSMSAGKTTAARTLIRRLVREGRRVAGAKLTGAGRYRDILAMSDAGAAGIVDFVDAGLPSTVCPAARFETAAARMLSRIEDMEADVAVIEAGASPLEPYNGRAAIDALGDRVRLRVLAASDPYAAVGVERAFGLRPDIVTGIAANTRAGIELCERLTGVPTLDLTASGSDERLDPLLERLFVGSE